MASLPAFGSAAEGFDPAQVDSFISRLIQRSKAEIAAAHDQKHALADSISDLIAALDKAKERISVLELKLEDAQSAAEARESRLVGVERDLGALIDALSDGQVVEEPSGEQVGEQRDEQVDEQVGGEPGQDVDVPEVEESDHGLELRELTFDEKAAKAEKAIRGRFLSQTST